MHCVKCGCLVTQLKRVAGNNRVAHPFPNPEKDGLERLCDIFHLSSSHWLKLCLLHSHWLQMVVDEEANGMFLRILDAFFLCLCARESVQSRKCLSIRNFSEKATKKQERITVCQSVISSASSSSFRAISSTEARTGIPAPPARTTRVEKKKRGKLKHAE